MCTRRRTHPHPRPLTHPRSTTWPWRRSARHMAGPPALEIILQHTINASILFPDASQSSSPARRGSTNRSPVGSTPSAPRLSALEHTHTHMRRSTVATAASAAAAAAAAASTVFGPKRLLRVASSLRSPLKPARTRGKVPHRRPSPSWNPLRLDPILTPSPPPLLMHHLITNQVIYPLTCPATQPPGRSSPWSEQAPTPGLSSSSPFVL